LLRFSSICKKKPSLPGNGFRGSAINERKKEATKRKGEVVEAAYADSYTAKVTLWVVEPRVYESLVEMPKFPPFTGEDVPFLNRRKPVILVKKTLFHPLKNWQNLL